MSSFSASSRLLLSRIVTSERGLPFIGEPFRLEKDQAEGDLILSTGTCTKRLSTGTSIKRLRGEVPALLKVPDSLLSAMQLLGVPGSSKPFLGVPGSQRELLGVAGSTNRVLGVLGLPDSLATSSLRSLSSSFEALSSACEAFSSNCEAFSFHCNECRSEVALSMPCSAAADSSSKARFFKFASTHIFSSSSARQRYISSSAAISACQ
mmetsp:Transcript_90412/g.161081  ORF Transcript_90412/g.161081 Transcript_90412/m.161081 type:complete len:208 (-) Transcript_90412:313-936(-)